MMCSCPNCLQISMPHIVKMNKKKSEKRLKQPFLCCYFIRGGLLPLELPRYSIICKFIASYFEFFTSLRKKTPSASFFPTQGMLY